MALWIAASVTSGAGAPLRFATLAVLGLMGARVLEGRDPAAVLTAVAGMALGLGLAAVVLAKKKRGSTIGRLPRAGSAARTSRSS